MPTTDEIMARAEELADIAESDDFQTRPATPEDVARIRAGRPRKDSARKGETPAMSVRMPVELRSQLDVYAASHDLPTTEVIRRAVAVFLAADAAGKVMVPADEWNKLVALLDAMRTSAASQCPS
ncbi:hypothetical protein [Gordonia rhizosphera]|uniref:Ribbon-helix-helix protein CopG domain-containing protein n=1 Tax=Gordonia rhizosphera NBRC 16068 TaxID=1108045 RepID=K6X2K5_9ACTN|nr:hypothetical protein [Gordonia rhizosphera]GAB93034.1 hypothetical protein GORHZ_202_00230 [Gordonia rhizosphera NBRC 16068]